jgi:predicted metal-dependent hydrolase
MQTRQTYVKGADPEIFLIEPLTGRFMSSVGLIGGSKNFPMPIGEGCAVQEDNVTVEFNTPPCKTAKEYIEAMRYNLDWITKRASELGLSVSINPSAIFDDEQLNSPAAQEFGCEPDYNAWLGGKQNPRPKAANKNLRSAGGHIHVSVPDGVDIIEVVKAMDLFVGCQMLEFDHDTGRRELYGKAGAFRKKSYGVEYRAASNAWIASDEKIQWAWDQTDRAVEYAKSGKGFTKEQSKKIQDCINNSDIALLAELKADIIDNFVVETV